MTDSAPVFLALLLVIVNFLLAMRRGVVGLLASGVSVAVGIFVIYLVLTYLPGLSKRNLGVELVPRFTLAIAVVFGLFAFLPARLMGGFFFSWLFNRDRWLHRFSSDLVGGLLSIGPSLIAVFVFFTCLRAAGTVSELNYVDSLAREGIRDMGKQIPPMPPYVKWRNSIEALPGVAAALDVTDPFSRRAARNAAAFVLATGGADLQAYLRAQPETEEIASLPLWRTLAIKPELDHPLQRRDRINLVLSPVLRTAVEEESSTEIERLSEVVLAPVLQSFVDSLASDPLPTTEEAPRSQPQTTPDAPL